MTSHVVTTAGSYYPDDLGNLDRTEEIDPECGHDDIGRMRCLEHWRYSSGHAGVYRATEQRRIAAIARDVQIDGLVSTCN